VKFHPFLYPGEKLLLDDSGEAILKVRLDGSILVYQDRPVVQFKEGETCNARAEAQVSAPAESPAGSEHREVVPCDREPGRGNSPALIADRCETAVEAFANHYQLVVWPRSQLRARTPAKYDVDNVRRRIRLGARLLIFWAIRGAR